MASQFTVDYETWFNAVIPKEDWSGYSLVSIVEPTQYLLDLLHRNGIIATFYCLGWLVDSLPSLHGEIIEGGHKIASHGYWHGHNESAPKGCESFRSPYWDTTPMPWPPSGGFFFRAMPYEYVKWAVEKSGVWWCHPHDLMEDHPKIRNPLLNLKRHIGLKTARSKLERLVREVEWVRPRD